VIASAPEISKGEFTELLKAIAKNASNLSCNERRKKAHDFYKEKPFVQRVDGCAKGVAGFSRL